MTAVATCSPQNAGVKGHMIQMPRVPLAPVRLQSVAPQAVLQSDNGEPKTTLSQEVPIQTGLLIPDSSGTEAPPPRWRQF
ncbi:unnamed protein product [Lota lota]